MTAGFPPEGQEGQDQNPPAVLSAHRSQKTETVKYTIGGEEYDVRTMTRKEKADFVYSMKAKKDMLTGDIAKMMIKPIYNCFGLKDLAVKAKDAGFIKAYYDVVEMLFEPDEILEITGFIFEINKLSSDDVTEELESIKKYLMRM